MSTFNEVTLIGHLGQNPEVYQLGNKSSFVKLQLATNKRWKKDGKNHERTDWHTVIFPHHLVDIAQKYLTKGSKILVKGELRNSKWNDKEGNQRFSTFVSSHWFRFLDKANKENLKMPAVEAEAMGEDIVMDEDDVAF